VEARRRHVPPPIVISERGREDTAAALHGSQIQLRPAVQSVSDEPPADQVSAGVCGHAGEVLECGRGEEVVEANTADGRVGVESCNDGITEGHDVNEPRPGPETVRKRAGLPRCRYRRRYSIADCITPRGYSSLSPVEARVEVPYSPAPEVVAVSARISRRCFAANSCDSVLSTALWAWQIQRSRGPAKATCRSCPKERPDIATSLCHHVPLDATLRVLCSPFPRPEALGSICAAIDK
jgi:hypothetical protein